MRAGTPKILLELSMSMWNIVRQDRMERSRPIRSYAYDAIHTKIAVRPYVRSNCVRMGHTAPYGFHTVLLRYAYSAHTVIFTGLARPLGTVQTSFSGTF